MAKKRRRPKPLLIIIVALAILLIMTAIFWLYLSSPIDKKSDTNIKVVIPAGTSTNNIAEILKEKNLIRSETFFKIHVKLNRITSLKASTYTMKKSMNLDQIVEVLEKGNTYNPDEVKITFKEGEWFTDYCKEIAAKTNNTYEDVIAVATDKAYITTLINKYWFLTENILTEDIYYPLEGYLAPDTYHFEDKDVKVTTIIEKMLDQTEKNLAKYKDKAKENIHYYITMASLVELEGTNTENRKMIAGIFENRLAANMNLGSDVTTYYALQHPMTSDLTTEQFATINPYNTRATTMHGKLPIGPICSPSVSSLEAAITPSKSTYLYFVADKKGRIYYTSTLKEHEIKVAEIKEKGEWIW